MKKARTISFISACVLILFVFLALGSGDDSGVDRGSDSSGQTTSSAGQEETEDSKTKYQVMQEYDVNGLIIIIGEVEVQSDKILVGITVKNNSSNKLSFYPDQGSLVIGSMQLDSNMFMSEGNASGEIMPGVEKTAVIYFTTPEGNTIPEDKTITLYLGDVYNVDTYASSNDFTVTITLE
jgi:hypothetical protein